MTAWQTIDLTDPDLDGRINAKRGHVCANGETIGHLSDALSVLVSEDAHIEIHASLYTAAAKAGVPVVFCDHYLKPLGIMLPNSEHTRVAARHQAQVELSKPRKKQAWQEIVRAKITNQAFVVCDDSAQGKLIELSRNVRSGDSSNSEAHASRMYWRAMFGDEFRRDQDGNDEINGALNYGYTVLRGTMARAVVATGLWPTLGIHHHSRSNWFCLVDDLMEPFRPAVDRAVLGIDSFPSADARHRLVGILDDKFDDTTTRVAIQEWAESSALFIEGEIDDLSAPRMTK